MIDDPSAIRSDPETAVRIRVRGLVQGVGFRPTVWRLAQRFGLRGSVANDGQGATIHACGPSGALDRFVAAIRQEAPPLARIEDIVRETAEMLDADAGFRIAGNQSDAVRTGVVPDAASCAACVAETLDPLARRYRYPFTNCTHCGPRLSIIQTIPYDRASTTMRAFPMCAECRAEYEDPSDRRFHAQPIACHSCGPKAWLERADGGPVALEALTALDAVDAVCSLLQQGHIVAIKGVGGFQLACDATSDEAVSRLRALKHRERKPFALMARDPGVIRSHVTLTALYEALLQSPAAPIVIASRTADCSVAASVAPGIRTLGFMLPNSPLHHLLLQRMDRPVVLTSGNLSDEPQCIDNDDARERLGRIADFFLFHDRDIARRVDDSVVRVVAGEARVLRRARGYAPAPLRLPAGFDRAPAVLTMGGELKNTFCLLRDGHAVISHHIGDLEDARALADYRQSVDRYLELFEQQPVAIAIDLHPEYLSSKIGRDLAGQRGIEHIAVQHHHAHLAACLAENGVPLDAAPVFGVMLDGLGLGDDGTLWGGEFLRADYRTSTRLATFKPVAMPGGAQCIAEPWRNTYAHLMAAMSWRDFAMRNAGLELFAFLDAKPRATLDAMIGRNVNSPLASSCGRLFDAAAAAAGVCRERALYEGQAAIEFEALVDPATLGSEEDSLAYPFVIARMKDTQMPYVEPRPMWQALLGDLARATPVPVIAARFHKGLAIVIAKMIDELSRHASGGNSGEPTRTVALSGGVFQNRILLEQVIARLESLHFRVLTHRQVPANDGGLSLGQAAVAAARLIPA